MSVEKVAKEMDKNLISYFAKVLSGWNHGPKNG